jgi:hypothetical protein|tara:strand:- start:1170 stop:1415 length:246 start_codon:yes stop_codon:yes gene_type:complete
MKAEDITDEQVKERLIENTFNDQTVLEVFAYMKNSVYVNYAAQVAKEKVNKIWENTTGSKIEELKQQMVNQAQLADSVDEG